MGANDEGEILEIPQEFDLFWAESGFSKVPFVQEPGFRKNSEKFRKNSRNQGFAYVRT